MKVVSNAGPLIALGKLGQLSMLLTLYGDILIPREVYNEVVINGLRLGADDAPAIDFLVQQGYIQVVEVALPSPLPVWAQSLDAGEIEVLYLASSKRRPGYLSTTSMHGKRPVRSASPSRAPSDCCWKPGARAISLQAFELLIQEIKYRPDFWISAQLCDRALAQARQEAAQ